MLGPNTQISIHKSKCFNFEEDDACFQLVQHARFDIITTLTCFNLHINIDKWNERLKYEYKIIKQIADLTLIPH